jgi:hypothetical protein
MKMKTIICTLFVLASTSISFGQDELDKVTDSILLEGKKLYMSEMASWHGTDIFLERFKDQRANIGGYFSYSEANLIKCIFFSKGEDPEVLGTISFDNTYNSEKAVVNGNRRDFTIMEMDIYSIRKAALSVINSDTLFRTYKNTNLNIIPLIEDGQKKVYVITGPQITGVIVFGNDYLLTFDQDNKLITKKQLHKNIMPMNYGKEDGKEIVATMHSHLPETGDLITATDICTLMLYEKLAKWKQHIVISENYISLWDCEKDEFVALTKKAWENIYSDQKRRKKRN